MAATSEKRRRVQPKRESNGYAMKAWLDTSRPMPIHTLTIDDVVKAFFETYKATYGKKVPMELGATVLRIAAELKADYSKQTRFKFLRDLKGKTA